MSTLCPDMPSRQSGGEGARRAGEEALIGEATFSLGIGIRRGGDLIVSTSHFEDGLRAGARLRW